MKDGQNETKTENKSLVCTVLQHAHADRICIKILDFHCSPVLLISSDHRVSDNNFYTHEATLGIKLYLLNFSKIERVCTDSAF